MSVFDNIKKYSKIRGMSLQDVALKAGLSKNVIYQYNKGKSPSLDTLKKIAHVLGVSVDILLGDNSLDLDKTNDSPTVLFRSLADPDGMSDKEYKAYSDALKRFADFTRRDIEQERKNRE